MLTISKENGEAPSYLESKDKRKTYRWNDCLPEVFLELLQPTFMTLSESKLLERCIRGTTQNPNECLNSMVWVRCPKHKHHGVKVVRFAAASAAYHFHKGAICRMEIMGKLSIPGSMHTKQSFHHRDKKRLQRAETQATAKEKRYRQAMKIMHIRREEALRELEGVTYEAGSF